MNIKKLFKRIKKWIKNLLKNIKYFVLGRILRRESGKKHNYRLSSDIYVMFENNKWKKLKLRKYISQLATKLCDFNFKGYNDNRRELIEEFEFFGLKGMNKHYEKEIKEWIKRSKSA